MTNEDVIKKMVEFEAEVKKIDKLIEEIRFLERTLQKFNPHNDKLFLLSENEYNLVRENIGKHCSFFLKCKWWLRSHDCNNSDYARVVDCYGDAYYSHVDCPIFGAVVAFIEETNAEIGTRKVKYDFPFIYVGNNLWISEVPIFWSRFDGKSNDYEKSEIRQKILKWAEERSNDEK